ncbi:hypothetical protein Tco_0151529 [Tanacetum coccineum]
MWMYECNKGIPWVLEKPWSKSGLPYEIIDHICEPFCFKNRATKWPTCNWNGDGFCNGGELPRMVRVGYMTYFQDNEWFDDLFDSNLKEEALKQKSHNSFNNHTERDGDDAHCESNLVREYAPYEDNEEEQYEKGRCESLRNPYHGPPVCIIRRFEMIKYSFGSEEKYVAIKENEYDDLTRTEDDACHAYQEIFLIMDEGWLVTRAEE